MSVTKIDKNREKSVLSFTCTEFFRKKNHE